MLDMGMTMSRRYLAGSLTALLLLAGCSNVAPSGSSAATPSVHESASASASAAATPFPAAYVKGAAYAPRIDPANFVEGVDNPYFPLVPGTQWVMKGQGESAGEVTTTQVTRRTKSILGITCVVVRDRVDADGKAQERTLDWYAQDVEGNVWYMGEQTAEYKDGKVSSRAGSWEAGVDGAVPGIIMPAQPVAGLTYRQEFYQGEAEDLAKIVDLSSTASPPFRSFTDVLVTEDWTPLEPDTVEQKFYAPGIGLVMERLVKGGNGTNELTGYSSPG
jgi:hypothetical protein